VTEPVAREFDLVALRADLPEHKLVAGDVGTVVMVYRDGEAYEVEFVAADGQTLALETLRADQVQPMAGRRILHARDLASA
jgi:hypothetical protein